MSKIYILLLCLATMVSSCSNDDYYSADGTGTVVFQGFDVYANFTNVNTESRTESATERNVVNNDFKNGFSISMKYHDEVVYNYVMSQEDIDKIVPPEGSEVSPVDWTDLMKPIELRAGKYMVNVNFSDLKKEGFEMPCFSGSKEITLKKDETLTVDNILCKPANSKFIVSYTEVFKKYFSDYSFSIVTERGNEVVFTKDESRPAYISPGKSDLYVTVEREGQSKAKYKIDLKKSEEQNSEDGEDSAEDISNGIFKAGREYVVTLDVNVGSSTMEVKFSETFGTEDVSIDVSHSAFNANPPILTPNGFENGVLLDNIIEGGVDETYSVAINAEGLIKECKLITTSAYLIGKGWPETVDLASTSEEEKQKQQKLAELGLIAKGFGVNIDQMAYIDFTDVINNLPRENKTDIQLIVTDKYSKTSEDFVFSAQTKSCEFIVEGTQEKAKFLGNECKVDVSFIKGNPKNVEFFLTEESGDKKLDVKDIQKVEEPSEDGKEHHIVTLKASDDVKFINPFDVKAKYLDYDITAKSIPVSIGILIDNEADVWAKRAYIHVYNDDMKNLKVQRFDGNNWVDVVTEIPQDRTDFLLAKELPSDKKCQFRVLKGEQEVTNIVEAKTEEELQIPNGGFEEWLTDVFTYTITLVGEGKREWYLPWTTGGQTQCWAVNSKKTMLSECTNWNQEYKVFPTISWSETNKNSGNKSIQISTIATGAWAWPSGRGATPHIGEVWLGTSDNGGNYSIDGYEFFSRPTSVSFWYQYIPYSEEKFYAKVELRDIDDNVIASKEVNNGSANSVGNIMTIELDYSKTLRKATKLIMHFKSSTSSSPGFTPKKTMEISGVNQTAHIGSILRIDDIQLIYE